MREQLEQNILDNPHDDALRLIYADWLEENGENDRAEFVRAQIALEDENLSTEDRQTLAQREAELLEKYQREWLGGLAPFLLDGKDDVRLDLEEQNCEFRFRRGFFEELHIKTLGYHLAQAMVTNPLMNWVRNLAIDLPSGKWDYSDQQPGWVSTAFDTVPDEFDVIDILKQSPYLKNVRCLRVGEDMDDAETDIPCYCYVRNVVGLVAMMPQLEELHLLCKAYEAADLFALSLPHLRVLRMYHLGGFFQDQEQGVGYAYPLDILAKNTSFQNLEVLRFHPHASEEEDEAGLNVSYIPLEQVRHLLEPSNLPKLRYLQIRLSDMGNEGCKAIVESGILKRLEILDLRHGEITDEGAKILATCPDFRNLKWFDIQRNSLTEEGINSLQSNGVDVRVGTQLNSNELGWREYLYEGDSE
ncbi:MAG: TIGR02996 domain-containing protein [Gemmataceae bacterium]